jgi:hypothetical protein
MLIEKNEAGGKSVFLAAGDSLADVPKSHRELLTPRIREIFTDPEEHFRQAADSCPFSTMAAWLRALLSEGNWVLALHRGKPASWTEAGFLWFSENVCSAEITPAKEEALSTLPRSLQKYYSLVDGVRWMEFGSAGGLNGCEEHTPLTEFSHFKLHGAEIDPTKTFIFGWSPGGNMLIYTEDGRGGWLCHENGKIHLLGSIEDTILWVYGELLVNRCPDFDYSWA